VEQIVTLPAHNRSFLRDT